MVYAHPKNSKNAMTIFIIVIIIFIIGSIFVFSGQTFQTNHSVSNDVSSLFNAFIVLAQGDVYGFFDGLVEGIPIIAMFFVLFSIVHFLLTTVLKSLFSNKKIALLLSIAIAIYGFVNQKIYNLMLSLNGYTIAFLVFGAFVIMLWGFGKSTVPDTRKQFKDLSKQRELTRKDREKLKELLKE
ncbi:MAG: hypothetical protein ACQESC_02865 [Nanobdellota archaeon]